MRDQSAVLEFDQGEEDVVLGRQCKCGVSEPKQGDMGENLLG